MKTRNFLYIKKNFLILLRKFNGLVRLGLYLKNL